MNRRKHHKNKKQLAVRAMALFLVGLMLLSVLGALLEIF